MPRLPMKHIRKLTEQAYLIAFECKDAQLVLHLGLALQVISAKEVAEQLNNLKLVNAEDVGAMLNRTIKLGGFESYSSQN
ncbi:hypothetical protein [Rhizobium sp. SGZ-381]|uniref:hypothetical protein n=1 Tax=Rhizobium sp. SGZ-381 TaxID=3342800 RepID=UPI00366BBD12